MKRRLLTLLPLAAPSLMVALMIACGDDGGTPSSPTSPGTPAASGPPPTAPTLQSPELGEPVQDAQPTLTIGNAEGGNGDRTYTFEVGLDSAFSSLAASETGVREGLGGITEWVVDEPLEPETTYFWRVRATASNVQGPFSSTSEFRVREAFIRSRKSGGLVAFDPLTGGSSIGQVTGGQFLDNGWQALAKEDFIRYQVPTLSEGFIEFQSTNLSEPNPLAGKRALIIMWDPTKGEYTTNAFRMHLQKMDRNTVRFDDVRLRWISRGQEHNTGITFFDFEPEIVYNWRIEWGSFPGIAAQQARVFLDGFQILVRNYDPIYHPKTHWIELGNGPRAETLEQAVWSNIRIGER